MNKFSAEYSLQVIGRIFEYLKKSQIAAQNI